MSSTVQHQPNCEYIVVGSSAGSDTVASRLALAGASVGADKRRLFSGEIRPYGLRP
jgi:hypothetical protein